MVPNDAEYHEDSFCQIIVQIGAILVFVVFFFLPDTQSARKTHAKFSLPWAFESHEQKYKVIKSTASYTYYWI